MSKPTMSLPTWRKSVPSEPGCYLAADRYGRLSLHQIAAGNTATDAPGTLVRTSSGRVLFDPTHAIAMFCGPLRHDDVFQPEIVAEIKRAIDDIPAERVRRAEAVVAQNPRSRKAKAELEAAKRALTKSKGGA